MATTQEKFQTLLKDYLRAKKIRQRTVAQELGLTSSAVSQMLSGSKILFKMNQLNRICEMLALEPEQTFELQSLLLKMRNAGEYGTAPFARMLFALRSARKVSYRELSNLTGIPASVLQKLEKDDSTVLTPEIAEKLAPVLNCPAKLMLSAADITMNTPFYAVPDIFEPLAASEPRPTFSAAPVIPEVPLEELRALAPEEDPGAFCFRHALRHVASPLPVCLAAVTGSAQDFGMAGGLPLCVLLAKGDGADPGIFLLCSDDGFFLVTPGPRKRMMQLFTGLPVRCRHLIWKLPVSRVIAADVPGAGTERKK